MPGAEFVVLNDAAHLGNVQQPLHFTETVGRFLTTALRTTTLERGDIKRVPAVRL
jgi:hypothetical protein